jgi:hypothetical protein
VLAESGPTVFCELSRVGVCGGSVVSSRQRKLLLEAGCTQLSSVLAVDVTGAQRKEPTSTEPMERAVACLICGEVQWTAREVLTMVQIGFPRLLLKQLYIVFQRCNFCRM